MSTTYDSECAKLMAQMIATQVPPATKRPLDCEHEDFAVAAAIARVVDSGNIVAEFRVICVHCHEPMRFLGVPAGAHPGHPTCTIDGLELQAPIEPQGEPQLHAVASYTLPHIPEKH